MDTHRFVAEINNEAVTHVQRGALYKAARLFQVALASVRQTVLQQTTSRPGYYQPGCRVLKCPSPIQLSTEELVYLKPIPIVTISPNGLDNNFVFSPNSATEAMLVSTIVIFNLAIVHHINVGEASSSGTASSKNTHIILAKAKCLYEKTNELLHMVEQKDCSKFTEHATGVVDMIRMATMNNLARIHMSLNDAKQCLSCLGHLVNQLHASSILANTGRTRYEDHDLALVLQRQASWFLSNALLTFCVWSKNEASKDAAAAA